MYDKKIGTILKIVPKSKLIFAFKHIFHAVHVCKTAADGLFLVDLNGAVIMNDQPAAFLCAFRKTFSWESIELSVWCLADNIGFLKAVDNQFFIL